MSAIPAIQNDSDLLMRYVRDGNESAFTELVRRYERLVLGVAVRRIGDTDLARDVAQRVFAILARKAWPLANRQNIAAWLYRVASFEATSLFRKEIRRQQHEEAALCADSTHGRPKDWITLEDGLAELDDKEREALILRYFQDLDYPEMASVLGLSEAAARKRVSRGIRNLGTHLRRRSIGTSAAVLLAGAAALQSALPAHAVAVNTALATAKTLNVSFLHTVSVIMSNTAAKVTTCAATLVLVPLALHWQSDMTFRSNTDALESSSRTVTGTAHNSLGAERTQLETQLSAARTARRESENRAAELAEVNKQLIDEVVTSFGSVEEMARTITRDMALIQSLKPNALKLLDPNSKAFRAESARAKETAEAIPLLLATLRQIPALERDPAKAARFYAILYGDAAGLDIEARSRVENLIGPWVTRMQEEGLAFTQRPKKDTRDWDRRRIAAMNEMLRTVQMAAPSAPGHWQPDFGASPIDKENNATQTFWHLLGFDEGEE